MGAAVIVLLFITILYPAGRCVPARPATAPAQTESAAKSAPGRARGGVQSLCASLSGRSQRLRGINGRQDRLLPEVVASRLLRARSSTVRIGGEGDDGERHRRRCDFVKVNFRRRQGLDPNRRRRLACRPSTRAWFSTAMPPARSSVETSPPSTRSVPRRAAR